jgi:hypothetical protein
MFYIKGSKNLYLIDYNHHCNLPVWSNNKDLAVNSSNFKDMCKIQDFLKQQHNVDCQVVWE